MKIIGEKCESDTVKLQQNFLEQSQSKSKIQDLKSIKFSLKIKNTGRVCVYWHMVYYHYVYCFISFYFKVKSLNITNNGALHDDDKSFLLKEIRLEIPYRHELLMYEQFL